MKKQIYTIGHSTRTQEELIALLRKYDVKVLVDVRKIPRSAHNPQFNSEELGRILPPRDVTYIHYPPLGGMRRPDRNSVNLGWKNDGFRGFADYMLRPDFDKAARHIDDLARVNTLSMMCAEAVPWKCHRSLISDAFTVRGYEVLHIQTSATALPHTLTRFARVDGTRITYPPEDGLQPSLPFAD